jgi:hypothetical protein
MYKNVRINEYGCAMNLKHVATDYKQQVFNYNNKNSHKSYLKKLCGNICMPNWFWKIMSNKWGLQDSYSFL